MLCFLRNYPLRYKNPQWKGKIMKNEGTFLREFYCNACETTFLKGHLIDKCLICKSKNIKEREQIMNLFRENLTKEEVKSFKTWSREHPEHLENFQDKIGVWHPLVIAEYFIMLSEKN
jgi:hypothetical protein